MSDPAARAQAIVAHMMANDAFSRWMGIQIEKIEPGYARISLNVRKDMLNGFGVGHGGLTFSLADSALAFASNSHGAQAKSIENAISYPAPVQLGDHLVAEAIELAAGGPIANYQVTVTNQHGASVGLFRGTVYRSRQQWEEVPS